MKYLFLCTAALAAFCLSGTTARAQLLFGYEAGEPGMPYTGNPPLWVTTTSNSTGVTQGAQSITATTSTPAVAPFGGPASSVLTSASIANAMNSNAAVFLDIHLPAGQLNFGNVDLHIFQTGGPQPDQETGFSLGNLGAFAPNSQVTVTIPLNNNQIPAGGHVVLDPNLPWSYQIDLSVGFAGSATGSQTFAFDNMRIAPEPASALALCACGGLVFVRRRRA